MKLHDFVTIGLQNSSTCSSEQSTNQHTTPLDDSSGVFARLPEANNIVGVDSDNIVDHIGSAEAALFAIAFSTTGMPDKNQHPANISDAGSVIWNKLLESKKYLAAIQGKSSIQAWAICTKLFLDLCHRKGVTPFRTSAKKKLTIQSITDEYARYRSLCSSLEQQVCKTLGFDNLVESIDRGVWKLQGVEYKDKRFVIVLKTTWLATTDNVQVILHRLKRDHFERVDGVAGLIRVVSGNAYVCVRIQKFPYMTVQMHLSFSKDKLLALGIQSSNVATMLADFSIIARHWARTRKFVTFDRAAKQPAL